MNEKYIAQIAKELTDCLDWMHDCVEWGDCNILFEKIEQKNK